MLGLKTNPQGVIVFVENKDQLGPLADSGYQVARARGEKCILLALSSSEDPPAWLQIPFDYDAAHLEIRVISAASAEQQILQCIKTQPPVIFACCLTPGPSGRHHALSARLQSVLHRIKCPVAILQVPPDWTLPGTDARVLIPFFDDDNSRFALDTALQIDPETRITVASVVDEPLEEADRMACEQEFRDLLEPWLDDERVTTKLLFGQDRAALLLAESKHHEFIMIGSRRGQIFLRAVLGGIDVTGYDDTIDQLVNRSGKPVVALREYQGWLGANIARLMATGHRLLPALSPAERAETYRQVRRAARPKLDFFAMIGSSALIAALGLILNSPAVIIGAMLIAPLMSAIIGMGLAIVQGDLKFLGKSFSATMRGALLAMVMGLLAGQLYLDDDATSEMLARTRPGLLDLLVAIISGAAAAYALCRKNVSAALPGVAIAVALVPPLATAGLFLGMADFPKASGALLLFITNLAAITFASCVVFTLLGFRLTYVKVKDTLRLRAFRNSFVSAGILMIAVCAYLSYLTVGEIIELDNEHIVESVLSEHFAAEGGEVELVRWQVTGYDRKRPAVKAHVSAHRTIGSAEVARLAEKLKEGLGKPVKVTLTQVHAISASAAAQTTAQRR